MKKLLLILVGFALAVGVFGAAGYAYAQTQPPSDPWSPDSPGMGGRRGGRGGFSDTAQRSPGMNAGGNMGLLEDYMHPAIADALGLTVDELDALHTDGSTLWQYAEDQGLSEDDLQTLMSAAFNNAVNAALADGVITQEQADQILARTQNFGAGGFFGAVKRDPGMSSGRGGFSEAGQRIPGMNTGNMGLLEDYMQSAIADTFGMTVDELETMHNDGVTLWQYAEEQGLSSEEFSALMQTASATATNNAVADGAITQEQADFMLTRMQNFGGRGASGAWQRGSGINEYCTGPCSSIDQ